MKLESAVGTLEMEEAVLADAAGDAGRAGKRDGSPILTFE